jgi:hypothetical protein
MEQLGWIHFSPTFRDRVNTILDMMDEEGMVDELGVGAFRDAFADLFFPGISTIQTRAKYFFIIPYLIKDYCNLSQKQQSDLGRYLYDEEHELMWRLASKYNNNPRDSHGVIGITKTRGKRIARRPTSIYWNGLKTLGFIKTNLSLSEYIIRLNESLGQKLTRAISAKNEPGDDMDIELSDGHGIKVSTYMRNWKDNIDLPLEYDEADLFQKQITKNVEESLLGQLIVNETLRKYFFRNKGFEEFTRAAIHEPVAKELKANIILAHDLNEVVKGLHWVYCNEINKLHYNDDRYYEIFKQWKSELYGKLIDANSLSGNAVITIAPRAGYYSKTFIQKVLEMVQQKALDYNRLSQLVINQEKNIKGVKSRFRQGAEKDFRKGEAKSLSFLNYRFANTKTIMKDIFDGLKQFNA